MSRPPASQEAFLLQQGGSPGLHFPNCDLSAVIGYIALHSHGGTDGRGCRGVRGEEVIAFHDLENKRRHQSGGGTGDTSWERGQRFAGFCFLWSRQEGLTSSRLSLERTHSGVCLRVLLKHAWFSLLISIIEAPSL